jgi:hypothetical protein
MSHASSNLKALMDSLTADREQPHKSATSMLACCFGSTLKNTEVAGEGKVALQGEGEHDITTQAEQAWETVWHVTWTGRGRFGSESSVVVVLPKSEERGTSQGIPCAARDSMAVSNDISRRTVCTNSRDTAENRCITALPSNCMRVATEMFVVAQTGVFVREEWEADGILC